jgi:hypothetical protein
MNIEAPILQRIHDKFDTYRRYPYTDHSVITSADINSNRNGYMIKTYPGGCGSGYDGFEMNIKAEEGIFGEKGPQLVTTGRNNGGLITMQFESLTLTKDGLIQAEGKISKIPAKMGLIFPNDEGFKLFEELHQKLQGLRQIMAQTANLIQSGINLTTLTFKDRGGGARYDYDKKTITESGSTLFEVSNDSGDYITADFDSTQIIPFAEEKKPVELIYCAGKAKVKYGNLKPEIKDLDPTALTVFKSLHDEVEKLYKTRK